jgi:hypothetical protein
MHIDEDQARNSNSGLLAADVDGITARRRSRKKAVLSKSLVLDAKAPGFFVEGTAIAVRKNIHAKIAAGLSRLAAVALIQSCVRL